MSFSLLFSTVKSAVVARPDKNVHSNIILFAFIFQELDSKIEISEWSSSEEEGEEDEEQAMREMNRSSSLGRTTRRARRAQLAQEVQAGIIGDDRRVMMADASGTMSRRAMIKGQGPTTPSGRNRNIERSSSGRNLSLSNHSKNLSASNHSKEELDAAGDKVKGDDAMDVEIVLSVAQGARGGDEETGRGTRRSSSRDGRRRRANSKESLDSKDSGISGRNGGSGVDSEPSSTTSRQQVRRSRSIDRGRSRRSGSTDRLPPQRSSSRGRRDRSLDRLKTRRSGVASQESVRALISGGTIQDQPSQESVSALISGGAIQDPVSKNPGNESLQQNSNNCQPMGESSPSIAISESPSTEKRGEGGAVSIQKSSSGFPGRSRSRDPVRTQRSNSSRGRRRSSRDRLDSSEGSSQMDNAARSGEEEKFDRARTKRSSSRDRHRSSRDRLNVLEGSLQIDKVPGSSAMTIEAGQVESKKENSTNAGLERMRARRDQKRGQLLQGNGQEAPATTDTGEQGESKNDVSVDSKIEKLKTRRDQAIDCIESRSGHGSRPQRSRSREGRRSAGRSSSNDRLSSNRGSSMDRKRSRRARQDASMENSAVEKEKDQSPTQNSIEISNCQGEKKAEPSSVVVGKEKQTSERNNDLKITASNQTVKTSENLARDSKEDVKESVETKSNSESENIISRPRPQVIFHADEEDEVKNEEEKEEEESPVAAEVNPLLALLSQMGSCSTNEPKVKVPVKSNEDNGGISVNSAGGLPTGKVSSIDKNVVTNDETKKEKPGTITHGSLDIDDQVSGSRDLSESITSRASGSASCEPQQPSKDVPHVDVEESRKEEESVSEQEKDEKYPAPAALDNNLMALLGHIGSTEQDFVQETSTSETHISPPQQPLSSVDFFQGLNGTSSTNDSNEQNKTTLNDDGKKSRANMMMEKAKSIKSVFTGGESKKVAKLHNSFAAIDDDGCSLAAEDNIVATGGRKISRAHTEIGDEKDEEAELAPPGLRRKIRRAKSQEGALFAPKEQPPPSLAGDKAYSKGRRVRRAKSQEGALFAPKELPPPSLAGDKPYSKGRRVQRAKSQEGTLFAPKELPPPSLAGDKPYSKGRRVQRAKSQEGTLFAPKELPPPSLAGDKPYSKGKRVQRAKSQEGTLFEPKELPPPSLAGDRPYGKKVMKSASGHESRGNSGAGERQKEKTDRKERSTFPSRQIKKTNSTESFFDFHGQKAETLSSSKMKVRKIRRLKEDSHEGGSIEELKPQKISRSVKAKPKSFSMLNCDDESIGEDDIIVPDMTEKTESRKARARRAMMGGMAKARSAVNVLEKKSKSVAKKAASTRNMFG